MAATTSGWQWPVDATAMPAEKSRNSLPSTSSIIAPRPRLATSGYERVYDGEMARASSFTMRAAFGPGSLVLMTGPTVLVMVVMVVSSVCGAQAPGFKNGIVGTHECVPLQSRE